MLDVDNSMLLIIDIQEKLLNAVFNRERLENRAVILAKAAKILGLPVFITEQYPQGLGGTIQQITGSLDGDYTVVEKTNFNAFADEKIAEKFAEYNKKQVLICGIETHICVHQTAAEFLKKNYEVTVLADACGSRSEYEYEHGLKNIKDNGAKIKTTEMVLFELIKTAKHPKFKEIQALIK